jgi:DNA polymerase-1
VAPNLQNLPTKTDFGKQIRECLIAREGHILISADYSQIELRVLAHLSRDSELLRCFWEGIDVHKLVASKLFNVREPSSAQRDIAKTVNYSVLYGISPWGLAKTLKVSEDDAKLFLNYFFSTFNQVKPYFESLLERARKDKLVRSILGRIRWVKNLKGDKLRRVVLNTPVQGSAADIFKLAMVKVFNGFIKRSLKSTIILQIHDELLVECPQNEVKEAVLVLRESMENVLKLSVPLKVEIGGGKNWLEAKENTLQI